MAPVIQLSDLCKLHPTPGQPPVLDGVSLEVQAGETCGLCGPGASGKSLLLKILCGLLRPDGGEVTIDGVRLSRAKPSEWGRVQSRIGMLFQNNALFDSLTVFDNVAFPLRQRARLLRQRLDEGELGDRVLESLRGVGLAEHRDKMPSMLSGGQRKRVALARAVVARPPIVVYDEPTAGLDPVTTAKIYELLRRERELTGATVLIVSSDVPALRGFASRMLMLHGGRLRYDGPAAAMEDGDPGVRQFVRGELEGPL
ncbi:MAG: ATP-binding cassette domain-containing protein [Polyangia bacterium]